MSEDVPQIGNEVRESTEPIRIRNWTEIQRNGLHKQPINERIDAMTYIKPFPLKEVDLLTIKRFIRFCRFNSKNDWGIGLKILLDYVDTDAKTTLLYDKQLKIEEEISGLKSELNEMKEKPKEKKVVKGFGGGKKDE